jgi:hypothetical protein
MHPLMGGLLDSEWGFEAFYNHAITPWLQVSPDYQYIDSGLPFGVKWPESPGRDE